MQLRRFPIKNNMEALKSILPLKNNYRLLNCNKKLIGKVYRMRSMLSIS